MTIEKAFQELTETEEFKVICKDRGADGGKYRLYMSRFNRGLLKTGAMVEILIANGYEITANKAVKKKAEK